MLTLHDDEEVITSTLVLPEEGLEFTSHTTGKILRENTSLVPGDMSILTKVRIPMGVGRPVNFGDFRLDPEELHRLL